jgi:hypothetical protein
MRPVRIDEMQHGPKLAEACRELGNLAPFRQRVALSNHEPIGDLLKKISEPFVVRALRVVVLADQQQVVHGRRLEERRIQIAKREKCRNVGVGVALYRTL